MDITTGFSGSLVTQRKDKLGGDEPFVRLQFIGGRIGIDAGDDTKVTGVIHLERKAVVSSPTDRSH